MTEPATAAAGWPGQPGKNAGDEDGLTGPHPAQSPASPPTTAAYAPGAQCGRCGSIFPVGEKCPRCEPAIAADCPNECHGQPIPCWNPGGPCPDGQDVCEMCGECAYCRNVADLGSRDRYAV